MNHVVEKYEDQHLRATYVYAKANDAYAYSDSGCTKKINKATLTDIFLKGCLVVLGDTTYKAVAMKTATAEVAVTYVKADTTTASTAVLATAKSYDA